LISQYTKEIADANKDEATSMGEKMAAQQAYANATGLSLAQSQVALDL
jgi:hypothetical protein